MNHTQRKKIRHQVLNSLTFFLVAVNLIPIAWMAYCGFKDNNEILAGLIKPGRRTSDVIHMQAGPGGYLTAATDGTLSLFDPQTLELRKHVCLGTFSTSYHSEGGDLWALSSNKGLQQIDPATLEVRADYPISRLAELYGAEWKTLWVNDVRGSSLTGSNGTLYLSFNYKDYPGLTAFSPKDGAFRKVDGFVPKDMGTVRLMASMGDSLAIGTRQGVFFVQVPSGNPGKAFWAGEKLPDAPDRLQPMGGDVALLSLGDRACLFDFAADSVRSWVSTDALGLSRIASLAFGQDRLWIGSSQAAMALDALPAPAAGAPDSLKARDSLQLNAAAARIYRPGAPSLGGTEPAPVANAAEQDGAPSFELVGTKVSAILPLEDGKVLLGGPLGAVALLSGDGRSLASGKGPLAPLNIQWRNYVDLWRSVDFGLYLKNSLIICISVMLIAVLMASLGGYALARFKFPGKNAFGYSILATQMIPGIMLLLPVYLMFVNFTQATGIIIKGTYGGLILTYAAYFTPFSIWILRGFFASIPKELEEAALIDGCGPFKAFFRIIIPSAMPGIVATGVYVFLAAWDELMFAWVLTSESTYTIPVGIRLFVGNFQNRYDLMMAAATVSTIPVMILFFVLQKQIVSGLTAGAVKD